MNYTFEATNDISLIMYSSQIMNILDLTDFAYNYNEKCVRIQGQLLSLFGEPAYITPNLENAYSYVITATNAGGTQYVLTVYDGSSGPAIGGYNSVDGIYECATELKNYILKAEPSDYEYEGYYLDGPTKVRRKVENGKSFYMETEIGEEEFEKAYKECYPDAPLN